MSEVKQGSFHSSSNLYDVLIDHFRLDSHYSQTAVSDVYMAQDVNTQQSLALEILLPSFSRTYSQQFVAKSQAVSQLTHPNIATIHQVGYVSANRPYVAREFVAGYPLSERLQQLEQQNTPANSIYALKMVRELADALALAETQKIYHHYLCPEHLILKNDGTLLLVDLGVPELPGGYKAYKSPTSNVTPDQNKEFYLSPEQRAGKLINGRSHVYTLGIILQQLLTGIPPTSPPTLWQRIRKQNQTVPLRLYRSDLSPHLYELVEKCLHKEPWRRFSSLAELTAVIDDTLEAETVLIQTGTELPIRPTIKENLQFAYILLPIAFMFMCALITYTSVIMYQSSAGETIVAYMQQFSPNKAFSDLSESEVTVGPTEQEISESTPSEQIPPDLPLQPTKSTIEVVEPLEDQQYEIGSTVVFTWTWPTLMKSGQSFTVYVTDENGDQEVGQVITANKEGVYELAVNSTRFAQDRGIYLWRVALMENEKEITVSETSMLRLVTTPAPQLTPTSQLSNAATHTSQPSSTATRKPTAVSTATPIPTRLPTNTPWPTFTPTIQSTVTATTTPSPVPPTSPPPEPTAVPPTAPPPKATIPPPPPATATIPALPTP